MRALVVQIQTNNGFGNSTTNNDAKTIANLFLLLIDHTALKKRGWLVGMGMQKEQLFPSIAAAWVSERVS